MADNLSSTAAMTPLHVVVVGNYALDRQESMLRFADVLLRQLPDQGVRVTFVSPNALFGRLATQGSTLGKWLGYLDKFLVFPFALRRAVRPTRGTDAEVPSRAVVHILDHSNAMYALFLRGFSVAVTCHDLLAVRGALGEQTDCPASSTGRLLQRWILRGLSRATVLVCDSTATLRDAERIVPGAASKTRLVLLGQNHQFTVLPPDERDQRLTAEPALAPLFTRGNAAPPFLLHVGSSLRRKNRDGAIRILNRIRDQWDGYLVFAGTPLLSEHRALARDLGVHQRILEIERPSDDLLEALYNRAFALLYPSRYEGFGWPVIEAQACACAVVCSASGPVPEVAGEGALVRDVDDEEGFAADVLQLTDPDERRRLVEKGLANVKRFTTERMISDYLEIYHRLAGSATSLP